MISCIKEFKNIAIQAMQNIDREMDERQTAGMIDDMEGQMDGRSDRQMTIQTDRWKVRHSDGKTERQIKR